MRLTRFPGIMSLEAQAGQVPVRSPAGKHSGEAEPVHNSRYRCVGLWKYSDFFTTVVQVTCHSTSACYRSTSALACLLQVTGDRLGVSRELGAGYDKS